MPTGHSIDASTHSCGGKGFPASPTMAISPISSWIASWRTGPSCLAAGTTWQTDRRPAPTRSLSAAIPIIAQAWGKTGTIAPGLPALSIHALRGCRNRRFTKPARRIGKPVPRFKGVGLRWSSRCRSIAFGLPGFWRADSSNDKVTEYISSNPTHITRTLCRVCAGAEGAEINGGLVCWFSRVDHLPPIPPATVTAPRRVVTTVAARTGSAAG